MKSKDYEQSWKKLKGEMLNSYANYEKQKKINKDLGFHKILEGAQVSLGAALDRMDELEDKKEFSNLLSDIE